MPKMTFSDDNRVKSMYDFQRLTLVNGERARITCIEGEPEYEFVHAMRAPMIVNGKPVMEMQSVKGKSDEQREVMKTDFIGQHICLGDINVLSKDGADVKNCPVCKASKESDAVQQPQRKFAMHVIRYKTQPGTFVIQDPFMVELIVWTFAENRFNQLIDLTHEWGSLQLKDLNLGPCESKQYQKYEINIAAKAEWLESDVRKEQVKAVYANNKLDDLSIALGRKLTRDQVEEDLERVLTRYEIAMGRKADGGTPIDLGPTVDVASLLGDVATTPTQETKATEPTPSVTPENQIATADPIVAEDTEPTQDKPSLAKPDVMSLQAILDL